MGSTTDCVEIIKQVEDMIQIMFEKISRCCKYRAKNGIAHPVGHAPSSCLYYDRGAQRCEREMCPLLEEEK